MAQVPQEMTLEQKFAAVHAMTLFSPRAKQYMRELAQTDKPADKIAAEIVKLFNDWQATARRVEIIINYLRLYGDEE